MSDFNYIEPDPFSKIRFKKAIMLLLIIAAIIAAAVLFYLFSLEKSKQDTLEAYQISVDNGDYQQALEIYRRVKEKALVSDDKLNIQQNYEKIQKEIELDIEKQLNLLFSNLEANEIQDPALFDFAESMEEITAVKLTEYVRMQLISFLNGRINSMDLHKRIDQILLLNNVEPVMGDINQQIISMQRAVPFVQQAEAYLEQTMWYQAYDAWYQLSLSDDYGSFVADYAYSRLTTTKQDMYAPLLLQAQEQMEDGHYVTASKQLSELQQIFTEDTGIKKLIQESSSFVPEETVIWSEYEPVEIIVFKPLIVSPEIAFDGDSYEMAADDTMLTSLEFSRLLQELYLNDYVLISADSLYTADGTYVEVIVPAGKKPLIMVLDSLNYYVSRRETGNVWNLVLDDDRQMCSVYQDKEGRLIEDQAGEAIGILDAFVKEYPDFSYDGAKGVISFTGYECLMGYVVSGEQAEIRNQALKEHGYKEEIWDEARLNQERAEARELLSVLRKKGWLFASSSWYGNNIRDLSLDQLKVDTRLWQEHIASLTGDVEIYNYPIGAFLDSGNEKYDYLIEEGFRFLTGLGNTPYRFFSSQSLYADKVVISGYSLRQPDQSGLSRIIDAGLVLDEQSRP